MSTNWIAGLMGQGASRTVELTNIQSTEGLQALNSAYTRNSAGVAYGGVFHAPRSGNITEIWVAVDSISGTWGNTDGVIQYEIYSSLLANYRPAVTSAPTYSGNITLTAGDSRRWRGVTGLSHAVTANAYYFFSISDSDGGATDYATMVGDVRIGNAQSVCFNQCADTTNGWVAGSNESYPIPLLVKVDGSWYAGAVLAASSTVANANLYRGNRIYIPEPMTVVGVNAVNRNDCVLGNTFAIFADGVAPNGTALWTKTITWANYAPINTGYSLDPGDYYDLSAGWYRFVEKRGAINKTTPRLAATFANMPSGAWDGVVSFDGTNGAEACEDDGTGTGWTTHTESLHEVSPLLVPQTVASSGGTRAYGGG